ncbi:MAG: ParB N-terminal domain-containing protein [Alphaproteobacteria bacterium]|nr:ParB N-terminal domain-containing protein [Alphaproteobacteria bacterium]
MSIYNYALFALPIRRMRASRKKPNLDDILPSIRERGVLVPLLVRPNGEPDHFEIVAGRRRFLASKATVKLSPPSTTWRWEKPE